MIDPNFIFNNKELVLKKLSNKKYKLDYNKFHDLYLLRKKSIQNLEELKAKLNEFNKKITQQKRKPSKDELQEIKEFSAQSKDADKIKKEVEQELTQFLLEIPNLHDDSVPIGNDELSNKEVKKVGEVKKKDFHILDHIELGKNLKLFDLEAAAKITGSRFNLYKGLGAKLERALINFMLD